MRKPKIKKNENASSYKDFVHYLRYGGSKLQVSTCSLFNIQFMETPLWLVSVLGYPSVTDMPNHQFPKSSDRFNLWKTGMVIIDQIVQQNNMTINHIDHMDIDCDTHKNSNKFDNANEKLFKPPSPTCKKFEKLGKNIRKADLTPRASRLHSVTKTLRRKQIATMSRMKSFQQKLFKL